MEEFDGFGDLNRVGQHQLERQDSEKVKIGNTGENNEETDRLDARITSERVSGRYSDTMNGLIGDVSSFQSATKHKKTSMERKRK